MTAPVAELFDWQLKVLAPKVIDKITEPNQFVPISFTLYPVEVLEAAQKDLGPTKLKPYVVDIYKYAIDAQSKGMSVRASQLEAVLLTQQKLDKWLASVSDNTLLNIDACVVVFMAYARFHKERIEESEAVLDTLRKMLGVE